MRDRREADFLFRQFQSAHFNDEARPVWLTTGLAPLAALPLPETRDQNQKRPNEGETGWNAA
ncbi:MAG: hypothetical protein WCB50_21250, partial [Pseudolabrys sp.]